MTDVPTLAAAEQAAFQAAKPFFKSRTIWALVVVAGANVANHMGAHFTTGQEAAWIDTLTGLAQGGGLTAAALFRILAGKSLA